MSRILVPGMDNGPQDMAADLNRVVKQHLGKNQPFMCLVVTDNGDAKILSNMDVHEQRVRLLTEVCNRLRGAS